MIFKGLKIGETFKFDRTGVSELQLVPNGPWVKTSARYYRAVGDTVEIKIGNVFVKVEKLAPAVQQHHNVVVIPTAAPRGTGKKYELVRDGVVVADGSYGSLVNWVHWNHSFSFDWALQHEGYSVREKKEA